MLHDHDVKDDNLYQQQNAHTGFGRTRTLTALQSVLIIYETYSISETEQKAANVQFYHGLAIDSQPSHVI